MAPEADSVLNAGDLAGTAETIVAEEAGAPDTASSDEAAGTEEAGTKRRWRARQRRLAGSASRARTTSVLADLAAEVRRLAAAAEQYQERASQREGVIDYLRSELELLRRGERRGLLRPILTEMSRLHADLARQATGLPEKFTVDMAARLLDNYADSLKDALEDNGVVTYAPEVGDAFDPRRHRQIKSVATPDPDLDGRVAAVRKPGYLDIEADSLLSPAEVTLYKTVKEEQ